MWGAINKSGRSAHSFSLFPMSWRRVSFCSAVPRRCFLVKRSLPPIISHIGRVNGTSGQPYWSLLTVVLLVFVAGPRTNGEEIVPFKPAMESFRRVAEDLGSVCGEDGRIWKAEEARRVVDNASRKRPRRKTRMPHRACVLGR